MRACVLLKNYVMSSYSSRKSVNRYGAPVCKEKPLPTLTTNRSNVRVGKETPTLTTLTLTKNITIHSSSVVGIQKQTKKTTNRYLPVLHPI